MKQLIPAASGVPDAVADEGTSRKAFLQGAAGVAAGAAAILATPKVAAVALDAGSAPAVAQPKPVAITPSGSAPHEPISAFVRDPERGEVTVMFGKQETTYRDPVLVKRLLDAAH